MNLLFVAAEPRELGSLLARCSGVAKAAVDVGWARTGSLAGNAVLLAANGAGWKRAAAAVEAGCRILSPGAVVSTGFCGALDPSLRAGEVVLGTAVERAGDRWHAAHPAGAPECRCGVVRSYHRVAQTAGEKTRLREAGGDVVEMEAAGVAEACAARKLPFYCIKAVTDLADESFGVDLNAALRADGHFDTMLILRESLRRPAICLPELLRLRNRCARAARALGDFLAECRF